LLGDKVRAVLLDDMKDEYINQVRAMNTFPEIWWFKLSLKKFTVRIAMIAADAIFQVHK
jgi:hypothetical protein